MKPGSCEAWPSRGATFCFRKMLPKEVFTMKLGVQIWNFEVQFVHDTTEAIRQSWPTRDTSVRRSASGTVPDASAIRSARPCARLLSARHFAPRQVMSARHDAKHLVVLSFAPPSIAQAASVRGVGQSARSQFAERHALSWWWNGQCRVD